MENGVEVSDSVAYWSKSYNLSTRKCGAHIMPTVHMDMSGCAVTGNGDCGSIYDLYFLIPSSARPRRQQPPGVRHNDAAEALSNVNQRSSEQSNRLISPVIIILR